MTQREKTLGGIIAAILIGWVVWGGVGSFREGWNNRLNRVNQTQLEQEAAETTLRRAKRTALQLAEWKEQSLPKSPQVALSLYRAWLTEQLEDAGLEYDGVKATRKAPGEHYTPISVTANTQGTLEQVTTFLYGFYASPQLHKLTFVNLAPAAVGDKLRMDFRVEALVVKGSARDSIAVEPAPEQLALADIDAYLDSIKGRNLFIPYSPPPPKRESRPPVVARVEREPARFDESSQAAFSGIVTNGDRKQAWFTIKTSGKTLFKHEGDELEVGRFRGTIKSAGWRGVLIESEDELFRLAPGKTLREGTVVPQADT